MESPTQAPGEGISRLIAQYFELVDLKHLAIPSSSVLKTPITQQHIYDDMFNEDLLSPLIPPATYRLRVLKQIIARIENDQQWDPEEDEIIEPLMMAMTDLMSQPSNHHSSEMMMMADAEEPQLSFVSYTVPTSAAALTDRERKQVTTFESRGLIYGSGSTGFRTWEAALHLGTYLASSDVVRGKKVIELGAGTGFISLLCKKFLGAERVLMTDGNVKLVDLFNGPCLEQNSFLTENAKDEAIQGRQWFWGEPLLLEGEDDEDNKELVPEQFDIALGADLTYDKSIVPLLVDAMTRLFSSHGVKKFILSATIRNEETFSAFLAACHNSQFCMEKSSFESPPFETQTGFFHATQTPIWTYIIWPPAA